MRIPRVAFAVLVAGILVLASALIAHKVRAHDTGTVVLLSTTFPNGLIEDAPLSTQDKNRGTFSFYGDVGLQYLAYKVRLLSRDGSRVQLAIRTRTYPTASAPPPKVLYAFERDTDPAREVWFEPGEPLKFDVPKVGTLILKGEWMDHLPVLGTLDPAPNELRLGRPLLLKDKAMVGDLSSAIGSVYGQDHQDEAMAFYIPGEGRFLISQLPMKGAIEAHVAQGRISFDEGGHSWELISGVPVCRADHVWVLHKPNFWMKATGPYGGDHIAFGNTMLVQTEPGVWVPKEWPY